MRPRGSSASNLGHAEIEGSEPSPGIFRLATGMRQVSALTVADEDSRGRGEYWLVKGIAMHELVPF